MPVFRPKTGTYKKLGKEKRDVDDRLSIERRGRCYYYVPVTRARLFIRAVETFCEENSNVLSCCGPPLYRNC